MVRVRQYAPLILALAATLLLCVLGEYTCETPTDFQSQRLPAILEIENTCEDDSIAMCLEFSGSLYNVQELSPGQLTSFAGGLEDCWVFRKGNCNGATLLEHKVTGTRKLNIGCSVQDAAVNAVEIERSMTIDCQLTNTPRLTDVFGAGKSALDGQVLEESIFSFDLEQPMLFINKTSLLEAIYDQSFSLVRSGADLFKAFNQFLHLRAVVEHTENCHADLVGETGLIGIAKSYLALYGSSAANVQAETIFNETWITSPPALTNDQQEAYADLRMSAVAHPVDSDLPSWALPNMTHGIPVQPPPSTALNATESGVRTISVTHNHASARILSGQEFCNFDGNDRWRYYKLTPSSFSSSSLDCCSKACFVFDIFAILSMPSFLTSCCLGCNLFSCPITKFQAETQAVAELAEVQLPVLSTTTLRPPIKLLI